MPVKSFLTEVDEKEPDILHLASPSVGTPQAAALPKKGAGRGNRNTNIHHPFLLPNPVHTSPPALYTVPDGLYLQPQRDHLSTPSYQLSTRNRPLTSHQKAVSDYRRVRINQILDTGIRRRHIAAKRQRQEEGILLRAWKRIRMLPSGWDSEDEGTTDKGKDDAKDKDDSGTGKGKSKDEEKAAAALRRAAGGVRILGGFALPLTDKELEQEKQRPLNSIANVARDDVGEEALFFSRAFSLGMVTLDREENADVEGSLLLASPPLKPVDDMEDERELQAMDEIAATIVKPRQGRKSRGGGGGASRKSKGGASKLAEEAKDGTPGGSRLSTARADNEDEDMHDEGNTTIGPSAELDDDERELLGEADTEDEEEDEDNMDED
jgi:Ino eighty subunit 1